MKIGVNFNETMIGLHRYRSQFIEYIQSQNENGYIQLQNTDVDNTNDTVTFKVGQHIFVLQFICNNHTSSVHFKLFKKTKYPEPLAYRQIPEMDIICNGVGEMSQGIASFVTEKTIETWGREEKVTYLRSFNVEYFLHLDRYLNPLYE